MAVVEEVADVQGQVVVGAGVSVDDLAGGDRGYRGWMDDIVEGDGL